MADDLPKKIGVLRNLIKAERAIAVAYSGGVDSTLLLAVAKEVLDDQVIAITAHTPLMPELERRFASQTAAALNVPQYIVGPDVMANAELVANPPHRCYICKKMVFTAIKEKASAKGFQVLAHGVNADDLTDFRPGLKAAEELGVVAPLLAAGIGKEEIRKQALTMGLSAWDRPAMSCLASRIPYETPIRLSTLALIEKAEAALRAIGIAHCRVRVHGAVARIEVDPREFDLLMSTNTRQHLVTHLRGLGFAHVALDLEGYTTGCMNRELLNSDETVKSSKKNDSVTCIEIRLANPEE